MKIRQLLSDEVKQMLEGVAKTSGWIGVDLDGTLAEYHGWAAGAIGEPIPKMVERVKGWLKEGKRVKIFTGRVADGYDVAPIKAWCKKYLGQELEVTATKDKGMIEFWDDKARQVETNTGEVIEMAKKGLVADVCKELGIEKQDEGEPFDDPFARAYDLAARMGTMAHEAKQIAADLKTSGYDESSAAIEEVAVALAQLADKANEAPVL